MPRRPDPPGSTYVARTLRRLREEAGLSAAAVAEQVGGQLSQSMVSRFEKGQTVPPRQAIAELAALYGADEETVKLMLAESREDRKNDPRIVLHRPYEHHFQQQVNDAEHRSVAIRALAAGSLLPGIAQTDEYAAVLAQGITDPDERRQWLKARQTTRQIIEDGRRDIEIVLMPNALGVTFGSREVMAGQIGRLIEVSRLPHVRLGVVTRKTPIQHHVKSDSTLYRFEDGRRVIYGVQDGTAIVDDEALLSEHEEIMDATGAAAVWGDAARAELGTVARQLSDRNEG